ncbi:hypothetical protein NDU88_007480 [Pleurodeles waltl]|uniref:Uncharacterized protein n=1 Tax=Pleurodeles waltl TaxID=8319 RepID=A0AAV7MI44_PLEWA|nr:hypothetical protein NDU88_007480 [Pleurodeles waltl]
MAYYVDEEEYFQGEAEVPYDYQMEERLVQALGHLVQDSVNQALIKALKPFAQHLKSFGRRELMGQPHSETLARQSQISDVGLAPRDSVGTLSSADICSQMASSVLKDYEYGTGVSSDPPSPFLASAPSRTEV